MSIDIQRARQETPSCTNIIHFNNAGSSLMPQPVVDATIGHLQLEAQIGGYEAVERQLNTIRPLSKLPPQVLDCRNDEAKNTPQASRNAIKIRQAEQPERRWLPSSNRGKSKSIYPDGRNLDCGRYAEESQGRAKKQTLYRRSPAYGPRVPA